MSQTSKSTMVVTGGAGFIGSNFVRLALAQSEARIVVLDKLTYAGHFESLESVADHPRFRFIQGDIARRDDVEDVIRQCRPTAILNFAAETHVDRSIDDPSAFVTTNVKGTFELLEATRHFLGEQGESARQAFRFLHVSTDEVFGSLGPNGRFSETTPYAPNSPYAASKAAADHLVQAYHRTYGLPTLLTNCSNNFGPYQYPEKLIPLMILNAVEGLALPIYGDGANVRDWLHVEDHCQALLQTLAKGRPGESYNVGGEQERTNLQVVDSICEILERLLPHHENDALAASGASSYRDLRQFVTDRPGHDQRYAIDPRKVQQEIGWAPRYDFDSGLESTITWYLEHRAWCADVQKNTGRERLGLGTPSAIGWPSTDRPRA